ncbi:MAG: putative toxin-antitoxin system toxin component, PIN family [Pirellulaceae bacterium]
MRMLLDTNILARAAAGPPGPAHDLLLAATQQFHSLIVSPFLIAELGRVLRYQRLRPLHGMTDDEIDEFVADLILVADVVDAKLPAVAISPDPDDDPILAAAQAGRAQVICTLDRHLLQPGVKDFCAAHGIEVLSDLELLARLRSV